MPKRRPTTKVSHDIIATEDLDEELKKISVVVQHYIEALIEQNLKAQQQSVKFKVESISYKNRALTAENELAKMHKQDPPWEDRLYKLRQQKGNT